MNRPINITQPSNPQTCSNKCNYQYDYNTSVFKIIDTVEHLSLKLVDNPQGTVFYSSIATDIGSCSTYASGIHSYEVDKIQIYRPSIHKFDGNLVAGELLISHKNIIGGKNLIVCIPILSTMPAISNASNLLKKIIKQQPTNINLNDVIPEEFFYVYTADLIDAPYGHACTDFIVFPTTGAIGAPELLLSHVPMSNINNNNEHPIQDLTQSMKKPTHSSSDSDNNIYIDCQPTGSDGEILIEKQKDGLLDNLALTALSTVELTGDSLYNLGSNLLYSSLYIIILFIVIFGIIMIFQYLSSAINLPTGGSNTKIKSTHGGGSKGKMSYIKRGGANNKISKTNLKL